MHLISILFTVVYNLWKEYTRVLKSSGSNVTRLDILEPVSFSGLVLKGTWKPMKVLGCQKRTYNTMAKEDKQKDKYSPTKHYTEVSYLI